MHPYQHEQNEIDKRDAIALTAFELKTIKGMMRSHPDFTRDGSAIQYAFYKLAEIIEKLEGL